METSLLGLAAEYAEAVRARDIAHDLGAPDAEAEKKIEALAETFDARLRALIREVAAERPAA